MNEFFYNQMRRIYTKVAEFLVYDFDLRKKMKKVILNQIILQKIKKIL